MQALQALSTWPVPRAAAAVLHGAPDPVLVGERGDIDESYPWASITKVCTALAVLVAVEEGTVGLDDPLGPPGASVAHLLAHASGLSPDGTSVRARPGQRRIYSNAGYDVLADHVSRRSAMSFAGYLRQGVLEPLSMRTARLGADSSAATGMTGSARDLLALGAELLVPSLLARSTIEQATTVAFPGLDGVLPGFGMARPCDWGLGVELRDDKSPHWTGRTNSAATFGHFGQAGGFVWVDPDASVVCTALTDGGFAGWAVTAWPALSDAVLGELGITDDEAQAAGPPGEEHE